MARHQPANTKEGASMARSCLVACILALIVCVIAQPPAYSLLLIENAQVYCPQPIGRYDILIGGGSILTMTPSNATYTHNFRELRGLTNSVHVIDATNLVAVPGIIDVHAHVAGGGGEKGAASRTPSSQLSQLIDAGITTLIGLRGTDGITRSLPNLLQTLNSLQSNSLTTFMFTGSYHVPVETLLESIEQDIVLLEKCVGVGEIAISDHRSSWPSYQELVQIVSSARVAGMLSAKPGVVHFHVGDAPGGLTPLWEIVNRTTIPITQMYPTHVSGRGPALLMDGERWVKAGGYVDFTADEPGERTTVEGLLQYRRDGINMTHVTVSSDCYGSLPVFKDGKLVAYEVSMPENLISTIRQLVLIEGWTIQEAFSLVTSNVAQYLQGPFAKKGELKEGNDADLLLLNPTDLSVKYVVANGDLVKTPTWTKSGMFPCT